MLYPLLSLLCHLCYIDDDWFESPFLRGGESLAHWNATHDFDLTFELLDAGYDAMDPSRGQMRPPRPCRGGVIFRVVGVGAGAVPNAGITDGLANRSCRTAPENAAGRLRIDPAVCMEYFRRMQGQGVLAPALQDATITSGDQGSAFI